MTPSLKAFLQEWNNPDERILVHTSGSTDKPKAMWAEKQKMLNSARITCDFLGLNPGDTALLCMPPDYIAGKMMVVRSIERNLRLITVHPSNHPLSPLPTSPRGGDIVIDFAAMVPSQVYCSLQVPEEREKLRRIKHLIIGGGAITKELQEQIISLFSSPRGGREGAAFYSTYGMTETLSHIALRRLNGPDASEWYTPFPSVSLTLNEDNCLVIDAPMVHDGILTTNDIAEIREDGCFRIIGRKDNVICSGGIKLQIEEIEEKLRPFIRAPFCITKRPDEKFGEVAVLLIEGNPTSPSNLLSPSNPLSLFHSFTFSLQALLDPYERPKDILYVEKIPMTETGKIDRATAQRLAMKK